MKKILGLAIAAILVIGAVGAGTWALFFDEETSTANILTAGTIDLKTNNADGVSGTFTATAMKPGDIVTSAALGLTNAGSIDGATLDISFSYVENDGAGTTEDIVDLDAAQFAAGLIVTTLSYGTNDLLAIPGVDIDVDGTVTMQELANSTALLAGLSGIDAGAPAVPFSIVVQLDPLAGNQFQNDGIDVTVTFRLNQ